MSNNLAKIIWFTGLSGSGKTTLSNLLFDYLFKKKVRVKIVDGDEIRDNKNNDFSHDGIIQNNKNIIDYCKSIQSEFDYLIVSVIAPFQITREIAKKKFTKNYIEIYLETSISTLIKRDTKGLYKKAKSGEIKNLIGFNLSSPYEKPTKPSLVLSTEIAKPEISFKTLIKYIGI